MVDRLTGLDQQPEVLKPRVVNRELRIAQTQVDTLRRVLRLSEMIHDTSKTQQDQQGGSQ